MPITDAEWERVLAAVEERQAPKKKNRWKIITGASLVALVTVLAMGLWSAFVLQHLYTWFVVPLGAPALNLWHFWGLMILLRIFVYESNLARHKIDTKKDEEILIALLKVLGIALGWGAMLLTGWLLSGMI